MGGFELLFQCVQVSGTLVTWASLSEAGRVDLAARTPLCVCGGGRGGLWAESKLHNH